MHRRHKVSLLSAVGAGVEPWEMHEGNPADVDVVNIRSILRVENLQEDHNTRKRSNAQFFWRHALNVF